MGAQQTKDELKDDYNDDALLTVAKSPTNNLDYQRNVELKLYAQDVGKSRIQEIMHLLQERVYNDPARIIYEYYYNPTEIYYLNNLNELHKLILNDGEVLSDDLLIKVCLTHHKPKKMVRCHNWILMYFEGGSIYIYHILTKNLIRDAFHGEVRYLSMNAIGQLFIVSSNAIFQVNGTQIVCHIARMTRYHAYASTRDGIYMFQKRDGCRADSPNCAFFDYKTCKLIELADFKPQYIHQAIGNNDDANACGAKIMILEDWKMYQYNPKNGTYKGLGFRPPDYLKGNESNGKKYVWNSDELYCVDYLFKACNIHYLPAPFISSDWIRIPYRKEIRAVC